MKLTGVALAIAWDDLVVTLAPGGESIGGDRASLMARSKDRVRCRRVGEVTKSAATLTALAVPVNDLAAPAWSRLAAFAQRTFAPATEASRLAGAGAGLSDNN